MIYFIQPAPRHQIYEFFFVAIKRIILIFNSTRFSVILSSYWRNEKINSFRSDFYILIYIKNIRNLFNYELNKLEKFLLCNPNQISAMIVDLVQWIPLKSKDNKKIKFRYVFDNLFGANF